jgi:hypothetical protein
MGAILVAFDRVGRKTRSLHDFGVENLSGLGGRIAVGRSAERHGGGFAGVA